MAVLRRTVPNRKLEPGEGFEPPTRALRKRCSTTELSRLHSMIGRGRSRLQAGPADTGAPVRNNCSRSPTTTDWRLLMTRFWPLLGLSALFAVLAFACKSDGGNTPKGETPASSPALAPTPKTYSERPEVTISADKKYSAVVETAKGTFKIELRPDIALETVNSFIFLAREGFYNGVTFHRVIPGFVAQG